LKDGFNIRGLNTAATLWCTAAVGTLAALGQIGLAAVGTGAVLVSNLLLRPLAQGVSRASSTRRRNRRDDPEGDDGEVVRE